MRIAVLALVAILSMPPPALAQSKNFSGDVWRAMDSTAKLSWTNGFLQGISIASTVAPMYVCDEVKDSFECFRKNSDKIDRALMAQYRGIALDQISDGLDGFYGDYRNRQIEIVWATTYVVQSIKGKPAAELEKQVETLRRNAAK